MKVTYAPSMFQMKLAPVSATARLIGEMRKYPVAIPEAEHFFGQSAYVRKMTIPKGMVVAGARHKTNHVFAVISGSMLIYEGDTARKVAAGDVFESKAGVQRVAFAPDEDCACIAIHGTEITDLAALELELVEMETNPLEVLPCPGE